MNIFSNIGITELIVILLLALLVVGPERLPEMSRKLAKTLRDVRKAYENLTRDLGPELQSFQETTKELRESVDSVRSIPQDVVKSVTKAADLDDTINELKDVTDSIGQVGQTMSSAGKMIKDPVGEAVHTARRTLLPTDSEESVEQAASTIADELAESAEPAGSAEVAESPDVAQAQEVSTQESPAEDEQAEGAIEEPSNE
jgi:Tat protein translocase TatB subunit